VSLIFTSLRTAPVESRKRIQTAPRSVPPSSSPGAPTTSSSSPSPSRSTSPDVAEPNRSPPSRIPAKPPAVPLIFCTARKRTSGYRKRIQTAPHSLPASSSPGAPSTSSGIPSASRSPGLPAEAPRPSSSSSGPRIPPEPSPSQIRPRAWPSAPSRAIAAAPRFTPPVSSIGAPIRASGTPFPSRSPGESSEEPNQAPAMSS